MSSVMRKNLPRPTVINISMFDLEEDKARDKELLRIDKLINEEMLVLMVHDNQMYPLKGMKPSRLPKLKRQKTQYTFEQLQKARALIE